MLAGLQAQSTMWTVGPAIRFACLKDLTISHMILELIIKDFYMVWNMKLLDRRRHRLGVFTKPTCFVPSATPPEMLFSQYLLNTSVLIHGAWSTLATWWQKSLMAMNGSARTPFAWTRMLRQFLEAVLTQTLHWSTWREPPTTDCHVHRMTVEGYSRAQCAPNSHKNWTNYSGTSEVRPPSGPCKVILFSRWS